MSLVCLLPLISICANDEVEAGFAKISEKLAQIHEIRQQEGDLYYQKQRISVESIRAQCDELAQSTQSLTKGRRILEVPSLTRLSLNPASIRPLSGDVKKAPFLSRLLTSRSSSLTPDPAGFFYVQNIRGNVTFVLPRAASISSIIFDSNPASPCLMKEFSLHFAANGISFLSTPKHDLSKSPKITLPQAITADAVVISILSNHGHSTHTCLKAPDFEITQ